MGAGRSNGSQQTRLTCSGSRVRVEGFTICCASLEGCLGLKMVERDWFVADREVESRYEGTLFFVKFCEGVP